MVKFIVPGKPESKARARYSSRTGLFYTPNNTTRYERTVRDAYKLACGDLIFEDAVQVKVDVYYEIPKSKSKKMKSLMSENKVLPTKKPDADNIAKAILDGLNKVAWLDDKQVTRLEVIKQYSSSNPYVVISISEDRR